jgi:hypothetical protein
MNASNLGIQYHSSTSSGEWFSANAGALRLRKRMAKAGISPFQRLSSERNVIVVKVPSRLVAKYPLTLDERIEEAKDKLHRMSRAEKWKLVKESFGMWENYPQDWLDKLRTGNNLPLVNMVDSSNRPYVIFSR